MGRGPPRWCVCRPWIDAAASLSCHRRIGLPHRCRGPGCRRCRRTSVRGQVRRAFRFLLAAERTAVDFGTPGYTRPSPRRRGRAPQPSDLTGPAKKKRSRSAPRFRFPVVAGVPTGIRTPVSTVKGWCPRPLDDGDAVLNLNQSQAGLCLRLMKRGGARRDRTADLLHAMQALSQLSYGPGVLGARHSNDRSCVLQA